MFCMFFYRGAINILSPPTLFYGPEYVPPPWAANSHVRWRGCNASVAVLRPTMHTYVPLQFSGLQSVISSHRFCLCFSPARCTQRASLGAKSSSGFVLQMWFGGTVLRQGFPHSTSVQSCIVAPLSPRFRKHFFQKQCMKPGSRS